MMIRNMLASHLIIIRLSNVMMIGGITMINI